MKAARIANPQHLAKLKEGVEAWNEWRKECGKIPNLRWANLSGANLSGANLSLANLAWANLSGTSLVGANLWGSDLRQATIIGANFYLANLSAAFLCFASLIRANLRSADLRRTNLCGANLSGANLGGAKLDGAELHDAKIAFTTFTNCDLSETNGLDTVSHKGPSSIGVDTIYRSKGKIPESFLRGCGVPESFITQMHALVRAEDVLQFYSCFISYSGEDEDFAKRLYGKMREAHLRVWFAPEDVKGGAKRHKEIETAIRVYDKLLIVLSDASLKGEWVMDELRKGFKAERDSGKRKLFPVRLTDYETLEAWECRDSQSGKDLAVDVRQYFIPDFSKWKDHDAFESAFARLVKDLEADSAKP